MENTINQNHAPMLNAIKGDSKILAFGDSLTNGMYLLDGEYAYEAGSHPYTIRLQTLLNSENAQVSVIESGICGEDTDSMVYRIDTELKRFKPDLVIILGGSNDLYLGRSTCDITSNIVRIHEVALSSSQERKKPVYTVAVTIPQLGAFLPTHDISMSRLKVNEQIRGFARTHSDRVGLLDLESTFYQNDKDNSKYWSPDGVHFSPEGYDGIGELVFDTLKSHKVPLPS